MVIGNVAFLAREDVDAPFVTERAIACNQVCANCVQAERLRALLASSESGYRADVCSSCGRPRTGHFDLAKPQRRDEMRLRTSCGHQGVRTSSSFTLSKSARLNV